MIEVPVLSQSASKANTRNWPSGANFNRSCPGRPDRPAELLRSPVDGVVVVTKAIPITEQGDCVFVVGTSVDRVKLL